ncbi:hypothetical protein [Rathayibacter tanaceti]|uniref:Uncharacterized protein n=1 Tax=Rathayibacter tanaceti TaxID=1671680 RepID=A0AAE6RI63_9MICO|nr:hypothetical protein [Rathayibacter tanaceti]QHC55209.1 hypothetical protein GSU10_05915 [Rathayibacter tanaceti]
MSSTEYPFPVAVSQLGDRGSRESQNARAVEWLLEQHRGSIVVVTPQKRFDGEVLRRLVARPGTTQLAWRAFFAGAIAKHRVIYARPDRQRLNDLLGVKADALFVVEWAGPSTLIA